MQEQQAQLWSIDADVHSAARLVSRGQGQPTGTATPPTLPHLPLWCHWWYKFDARQSLGAAIPVSFDWISRRYAFICACMPHRAEIYIQSVLARSIIVITTFI